MSSPVTPRSGVWPYQVSLSFLAGLQGDMVYNLTLQLQVGGTFMPGTSRLCEWAGPGCEDGFREGTGSHGPLCALPPDVDECVRDAHLCQEGQRCVNLLGTYSCLTDCRPGFRVTADGGSCEGDRDTGRGLIIPKNPDSVPGILELSWPLNLPHI